MTTQALLQQAKAACPQLAWLGSEEKNRAILQCIISRMIPSGSLK